MLGKGIEWPKLKVTIVTNYNQLFGFYELPILVVVRRRLHGNPDPVIAILERWRWRGTLYNDLSFIFSLIAYRSVQKMYIE